jgi:predicted nucleic acid-binding protein
MIVVSDTGPLVYMVSVGLSDYLPQLYNTVVIPPTVLAELKHENSPLREWITIPPEWLKITQPSTLVSDSSLDEGEREAISIALSLGADAILIDERVGREVARKLGLTVTGTLGVIIDGHRRKLFNGSEALDRLAKTNFYASQELLDSVRKSLDARI